MHLILKRRRISEANIQSEFYHQCRKLSIPCYLEYKFENSRFDAVIFDPTSLKILIIVEVKNTRKDTINEGNGQFRKYKKFNIPILVIRKSQDINDAVINILRFLWQNESDEEIKAKIQKVGEDYKKDSSYQYLTQLEEFLISKIRP